MIKGHTRLRRSVLRRAGPPYIALGGYYGWNIEITFRECKQIVGAGQQQVRCMWANIGAFHICLWTFTMTEAWAWGRQQEELVDRSASPWDSSTRRPSQADKRRAWRRELLGEEIRAVLRLGVTEAEIRETTDRLLSLAVTD